ncbi:hypothetical protein GOP47_0027364 [Adiantum capillus-veneris]|nr:hypothetical protein GOP47_0027364 [Adiantum capillus-veneris]
MSTHIAAGQVRTQAKLLKSSKVPRSAMLSKGSGHPRHRLGWAQQRATTILLRAPGSTLPIHLRLRNTTT